jgi:hypothetical protein
LEFLENRNLQEALGVLRTEIPLLDIQKDKLHKLACLMMITNMEELKEKSKWKGSGMESRKILLDKIYFICKGCNQISVPNNLERIVK